MTHTRNNGHSARRMMRGAANGAKHASGARRREFSGAWRALALLGVALAGAGVADAQPAQVEWERNVREAVATAQRAHKPILFWVVGRADAEENADDVYDAQQATFRDERVASLAQRFVTIRISPDTYRKQLVQWGVPARSNLVLVVTDPQGELLDRISGGALTQPESTARKLAVLFRSYRNEFYQERLREVVVGESSDRDALIKALEFVYEFMILSADADVAALLDREQAPNDAPSPQARRAEDAARGKLRTAILKTLAHLSTPTAVRAIMDEVEADPAAADVLDGLVPSAAPVLMEYLDVENAGPQHVAAYEALCAICRIEGVKPARFWENARLSDKEKELTRVRERARGVASRWSAAYAEYR